MKKSISLLLAAAVSAALISGCSSSAAENTQSGSADSQTSAAADSAPSETPDGEAESGSASAESEQTAEGSYTIGIGQFAEHGSLDNCRQGFVEGENLTVLYENAQTDGGTASQIATNFAGKGVDLMCGIATPMAQAEYGVAMKSGIPVIFTAVTDPVAAELANADGTPVGEITESTIAQYKELAPEYGFAIVETGISSAADVSLAADSILTKVDCMTNLTDNTVVASLPVILEKASAKNIPVFGSEIEQVRIGCLAAMGLDYVALGQQTGAMAAKVLKGEAKASEMNYETIAEAAFYGNTQVAENLGITFPEELTSNAAEMFSEIAQ